MRKKRKKKLKKDLKNPSILPVLFIIALLSLFSETVRTMPAGALSEKFDDLSYELPKLNSELIEKKLLSNSLSISNKIDTKKLENEIIIKEKVKKIVIAKTPQAELEKTNVSNEIKTNIFFISLLNILFIYNELFFYLDLSSCNETINFLNMEGF